MEKLAQNLVFAFFIIVLVYGFLADALWVRIVCFLVGIPVAIFWIGWDWFVAIIRHGRTYRG